MARQLESLQNKKSLHISRWTQEEAGSHSSTIASNRTVTVTGGLGLEQVRKITKPLSAAVLRSEAKGRRSSQEDAGPMVEYKEID